MCIVSVKGKVNSFYKFLNEKIPLITITFILRVLDMKDFD